MLASTAARVVRGALVGAAVLLGAALAGCQTSGTSAYRSGYDKNLTADRWAARTSDQALVLIGGSPAVWQKADEPGYVLETRPRLSLGWGKGYDAVLVKAGTYQLQTIVLGGGGFAQFGGFQGLGVASSPNIASFQVAPGEVVYVGSLDAQVQNEGPQSCWSNLSVKDDSAQVRSAFPGQVSYVQRQPTTRLLDIQQSFVRFPCGPGFGG
jgi:hypothetical protein